MFLNMSFFTSLFAILIFLVEDRIYYSDASIYILDSKYGNVLDSMDDHPTGVGPSFPTSGLRGHHTLLHLNDPCASIPDPPPLTSSLWFAVVVMNSSCLTEQIRNLEYVGYSAVILYNRLIDDDDGNKDLKSLTVSNITVDIPSTMVGNITYLSLVSYLGRNNVTTVIYRDYDNINELILILLGTLCLSVLCALVMSLIVYGCFRLYRSRTSILARWRLKWFPVHVYSKGDEYESCVICLDEYLEGDKLRVLSCGHAFHCSCVDPWLIKSKQECPLCKRQADLRRGRSKNQGHGSRSRDDDDDDDERTSLLRDDNGGDGEEEEDVEEALSDRNATINAVVHTPRNNQQHLKTYGATQQQHPQQQQQHPQQQQQLDNSFHDDQFRRLHQQQQLQLLQEQQQPQQQHHHQQQQQQQQQKHVQQQKPQQKIPTGSQQQQRQRQADNNADLLVDILMEKNSPPPTSTSKQPPPSTNTPSAPKTLAPPPIQNFLNNNSSNDLKAKFYIGSVDDEGASGNLLANSDSPIWGKPELKLASPIDEVKVVNGGRYDNRNGDDEDEGDDDGDEEGGGKDELDEKYFGGGCGGGGGMV